MICTVVLLGKYTPHWAIAVARQECNRRRLTLCWTVSKAKYKAGVTGIAYWGSLRINILAHESADERYKLSVLLHEIAHINVSRDVSHGKEWQKEVIRLYRKYDLLQEVLDNGYYGYVCEKRAVEKALARSK